MMDPMFKELDQYVKIPAVSWTSAAVTESRLHGFLEIYPKAEVFGIDPDEERVLIASRVIGERGRVEVGELLICRR